MGGFLGALAGMGMLLLIGVMFFTFLHRVGVMGKGQMKRLGSAAGMTLGMGLVYWLLGGLFYGVMFEPVAGLAEINAIFRTRGLCAMYTALEKPVFSGLFTGIFSYLGHFLGKILFDRYLLGGVTLALLMTLTAVCLLLTRLEAIFGEKQGESLVFLLLCLPGSLFFFLPGWAPPVLLTAALILFFLGKKIPPLALRLSNGACSRMLGISALFSAAVVFGAVMGRW